jgi:hypothetical protein
VLDDTQDVQVHRIVVRVAVPPDASAILPLPAIRRLLEQAGVVVLGMRAKREDERSVSDPSVLP